MRWAHTEPGRNNLAHPWCDAHHHRSVRYVARAVGPFMATQRAIMGDTT